MIILRNYKNKEFFQVIIDFNSDNPILSEYEVHGKERQESKPIQTYNAAYNLLTKEMETMNNKFENSHIIQIEEDKMNFQLIDSNNDVIAKFAISYEDYRKETLH